MNNTLHIEILSGFFQWEEESISKTEFFKDEREQKKIELIFF